jgi:hypothetical protein
MAAAGLLALRVAIACPYASNRSMHHYMEESFMNSGRIMNHSSAFLFRPEFI